MTGIYDKLQIAAKYKMTPGDVKALIDEEAIIDTANKIGRNALMMADIELKNSPISMNKIKGSGRVIYWKINEGICGLAWSNEDVYFFSGEVLTP